MTEEYPVIDNSDGLACEPMPAWGGAWTEAKLEAFSKYVKAYLTIMNKYRDLYKWKLIYFDGFAGSGSRGVLNENDPYPSLFDDSEIEISSVEYDVYVGAAERVLQLDIRGFDFYYFNEKDAESRRGLEEKLTPYKKVGATYVFRSNDANDELKKLTIALTGNNKYKALVLLDPFGMQLDWEAIASLKGCGADVWILVPTGVIITRLLDREGKLLLSKKLQKYFGLTEHEIRDFFYENKTEATLFGDELRCHKLPNTVQRIAELYVKRLKGIFEHVTEKPLVLNNTRGVPIFHFVFASNNKQATKIARDIVGDKRKKK